LTEEKRKLKCIKMRLRINCNYLEQLQGHPLTNQRLVLLELIRQSDVHLDAKELYRRANNKDESISLATVYRSLNLFKKLDLIDERHLGGGRRCFEIKQPLDHQHLVCLGCGQIIEFKSSIIDKLVVNVKRKFAFNVTRAELYLEGYCEKCEQKAGKKCEDIRRSVKVSHKAKLG